MDLEIKFLRWPDIENRLNVIARGVIDVEAMRQILNDSAARTQHPFDGEVLIDLRNAICSIKTADIYVLANEVKLNLFENKIALVSARDIDQYDQLILLSACISNRGFKIAAFLNLDRALKWLSEK